MATAQSWNPRAQVGNAVIPRCPGTPEPNPSLLHKLTFTSRKLLGAALLLLGVLMGSTLVLLPIGIPVVLLAIAMIAAPTGM